MKWVVDLDGEKLSGGKQEAHAYLQEHLQFADYYGKNLDALHDCLNDLPKETEIQISRQDLVHIVQEPYAYRILRVMTDAAAENPYLTIRFI